MRRAAKRFMNAVTMALGLALPALAAAGASEPPPVVTTRQISLDGKTFAYQAEAGRIAIRDVETGRPHAYMFYTAYRVSSPGTLRPVTFLWGGGPGGPSEAMDFTLAGPLLSGELVGKPGQMVPNPNTLLPDTDLVIVDEVGTGYSRPTKRRYMEEFLNTIGDTDSFAEFIRCWLIQHQAENAPVIVGGVSWGAPRAATVAYKLLKARIRLSGVIMASGEMSLNKHYISPQLYGALRVLGMSEIAFRWHKLSPALGTDLEKIQKDAKAWAVEDYAPALERVKSLSPAERDRIAAGLSRYTGIAERAIDHTTLLIPPSQFRRDLLRSEGKALLNSDMRALAGSIHPSGWERSALPYINSQMGYRTDMPYTDLEQFNDNVGYAPFRHFPTASWTYATSPVPAAKAAALMSAAMAWGAGPPTIGIPLPATAEAIELDPQVRFLIIIDRYDGESTCEPDKAVYQALPTELKNAIRLRCYPSGHTFWRTPRMASRFRDDVHAMIGEILH